MRNRLIKYVTKLGIKDPHDVETIVNDVLMDERAEGFEFRRALQLTSKFVDPTRNKKVEIAYHLDAPTSLADDSTAYEYLAYDEINEKQSRLQDNQRELIYHLANGTDERTTLIVQTFLELENPTLRSVAKHLNINHNTVNRALTRLARNYDEGLFGDLNDYFVA